MQGPGFKFRPPQKKNRICTTLSELWDKETSNFHLSVGEMTIILDDISCFLHKPIHGKLVNHEAKISKEQGAYLIIDFSRVDSDHTGAECDNMKETHISFG
jgi:hypothetical protein